MKKNFTIALIVVLQIQTGKAQESKSINDASSPESSYDAEQCIEEVLIANDYVAVNSFSFQVSGSPVASTLVIDSYSQESTTTEIKTDLFSNNNSIEVTVSGNRDYEFRLDNGLWQYPLIFELNRLFVRI
ncbi:MAG: hypothetical protein ABJN84_09550 [Flavobacteriaceae bacterium]